MKPLINISTILFVFTNLFLNKSQRTQTDPHGVHRVWTNYRAKCQSQRSSHWKLCTSQQFHWWTDGRRPGKSPSVLYTQLDAECDQSGSVGQLTALGRVQCASSLLGADNNKVACWWHVANRGKIFL